MNINDGIDAVATWLDKGPNRDAVAANKALGAIHFRTTGMHPVRPITGRGFGACAPVSCAEAAWLDKGLNRDAVAADKTLYATQFRMIVNVRCARLPLRDEGDG